MAYMPKSIRQKINDYLALAESAEAKSHNMALPPGSRQAAMNIANRCLEQAAKLETEWA